MKPIKSIILILLLAVSTLFNSCSSDDNDNLLEESLEGTFLAISVVTETFINDVSQSVIINNLPEENNFIRVTFNVDNTYFFNEAFTLVDGNLIPSSGRGTYSINGDALTLIPDENTGPPAEYTLSADRNNIFQIDDVERENGEDILRFLRIVTLERE